MARAIPAKTPHETSSQLGPLAQGTEEAAVVFINFAKSAANLLIFAPDRGEGLEGGWKGQPTEDSRGFHWHSLENISSTSMEST